MPNAGVPCQDLAIREFKVTYEDIIEKTMYDLSGARNETKTLRCA